MRDGDFPSSGFDYYALEKWDSSDPLEESSEQRDKHIELGKDHAALGHMGRRPYNLRLTPCGEIRTLPRNLAKVPTDLPTPNERVLDSMEFIWVRTAYGPGTNARFHKLLTGFGHCPDVFGYVPDDTERYDFADNKAFFAFFSSILELEGEDDLDDHYPDDAPEMRNDLDWTDRPGMPEEDRFVTH